jgi:hypothetical protein
VVRTDHELGATLLSDTVALERLHTPRRSLRVLRTALIKDSFAEERLFAKHFSLTFHVIGIRTISTDEMPEIPVNGHRARKLNERTLTASYRQIIPDLVSTAHIDAGVSWLSECGDSAHIAARLAGSH